ncbi:hypothetical protein QJQ45_000637 [Haematococcus lacustris]|nr:hypothetical protein QJQ45_000637 [Haematococcus lacustris]
MWCPEVPPRSLPQAPCSGAATQPVASEPGPSTPLPAKRGKRTKAEQAAESAQPTNILHAEQAAESAQPTNTNCVEHAEHWGEQVVPTGAVLVARAGSSASQEQGVPCAGV